MNQFFNSSSEKMPQVADESVDLILTDPPYLISEGKQNYGKIYKTDFGEWDKKFHPEKFIAEWLRVLKNTG